MHMLSLCSLLIKVFLEVHCSEYSWLYNVGVDFVSKSSEAFQIDTLGGYGLTNDNLPFLRLDSL